MILAKKCKEAYRYILVLLLFILLMGCDRSTRIEESRIAMGTSVSITVFSAKDARVFDDAFLLISDIEREISAHDSNSYISKINDNAAISPVVVPDEIYFLIRKAIGYSRETNGLFNPAIGALSALWNITGDSPHVPNEGDIQEALELISCDDIVLDDDNRSVFLKKKGMKLDLGGIGKGYAADRLKSLFEERGIDKAIINLGGNVYVIGWRDRKKEEKWRVGIINPLETSSIIASVEVVDRSIVTSGGYERYFEEDGKLYHHILDSSTGYPSDSDILSATIVTEDSTLADALSTATFVGGTKSARELSEKLDVYIIVYTKDGELLTFGEP